MDVLMPVSSATTRGPSPVAEHDRLRRGHLAREVAPSIGASASISARASCSGMSPGKTPPRIAPRSRMWRTSPRVSTPPMPATPPAASQSSQPPSGRPPGAVVYRLSHDHRARVRAVGLDGLRPHAVVPDQRIGEGDDLTRVGGVGDGLLVAGHRGVEDDLADRGAGRAHRIAVKPRAVLEQHVAGHCPHPVPTDSACRIGASFDQRLTSLNSGVPAWRSSSNSAVSTLVATAPERSIRCRPSARFSAVRDVTASWATCTSAPSAIRS